MIKTEAEVMNCDVTLLLELEMLPKFKLVVGCKE